MPNAILLAVNIVVVNEAAANIPKTNPLQSKLISLFNKLVANKVPIKTITTEIIFWFEGRCLSKIHSNKTPIHTVCINSTIAIDTLMYFTHK